MEIHEGTHRSTARLNPRFSTHLLPEGYPLKDPPRGNFFNLAVVATVIGLVLAEGLLRLTGLGTIQPEIQFGEITGAQLESGFFVFDKDLFWREPEGVPDQIHLGNHFVRVGDVFPPKERRLRVLCLGDSCTRLSRTNQAFSVRLQAALGPNAEVFNASLPGYTSHRGLAWLLATCPETSVRDGADALALLEPVAFLVEQGGDQSEYARSIRDRQENYRDGKAFRTPAPSG